MDYSPGRYNLLIKSHYLLLEGKGAFWVLRISASTSIKSESFSGSMKRAGESLGSEREETNSRLTLLSPNSKAGGRVRKGSILAKGD